MEDGTEAPQDLYRSRADLSWHYACPLHGEESLRDGYRRVFHTLLVDLIAPFGSLYRMSIASESGLIRIGGDDLATSRAELLPEDFKLDGSIDINAHVFTSTGETYRGVCIVTVSLDTETELDSEREGVQLSVNTNWSVFFPPHGDDVLPEEAAQYENNGPNLTKFLRSIVTEFGAVFEGGDDPNMVADGFRLPLTYE